MSRIAKIDPSCLVSKESLEMLISSIEKLSPDMTFVTLTQNAQKNIQTILQAAKIGDSSCYTMLRNIVLEYKNIFDATPEIHSLIEGFYQDLESLIKFVELSGEFTQNIVNIVREYFSRFI